MTARVIGDGEGKPLGELEGVVLNMEGESFTRVGDESLPLEGDPLALGDPLTLGDDPLTLGE